MTTSITPLPHISVTLLDRNDPHADYDRIADIRPSALAPVHQSLHQLRCGRSRLATPYDDLFIRLDRLCRQPAARTPDPSAAHMFVRSPSAAAAAGDTAQRLRPDRLAARLRRHLQRQHSRQRRHWMAVHSLHLLGNYWRLRGKPLHAMQCFQTALVVRPQHVGLLHSTAQLLLHLGRTHDAQQLVQAAAAAAQRPRTWRHWQTMGEISRRLNATQALRDSAHRAIRLHPRHALVWRLQGAVAAQRLQQFGESCSTLLHGAVSETKMLQTTRMESNPNTFFHAVGICSRLRAVHDGHRNGEIMIRRNMNKTDTVAFVRKINRLVLIPPGHYGTNACIYNQTGA